MFNLQLFAAEAVQGKDIIYLFRILSEAAAENAVAMAFTTENERSKSKDADVTATKDGSIRTPGATEIEISATAILAKGDDLAEKLETAMDNDELIEIWEVNLEAPGETDGKFKGTYYQGYLTEFTLTSSAEEHAEYECTFAINGNGAKGDVTVTAEQQEVATYVFKDTQKTGA
jgi:TP901-1 family phage major tail protein